MSNTEIEVADELVDDPRSRLRIGQGRPGPGRPKGSTDKVAREFREVIKKLLEDNSENFGRWLSEVADGKPSQIIHPDPSRGIAGGVIPGIDPDPAKALELIAKLAEYASPKQGRVVIAGDPDNPLPERQMPTLNITIEQKRIDGSNSER